MTCLRGTGRRICMRTYNCSGVKVDTPEFGRLIGAIVLVYALDYSHIFLRQLKVKHVDILFQSLQLGSLRDHDGVALDAPPENYLCHCLLVFLSQTLNLQDEINKLVRDPENQSRRAIHSQTYNKHNKFYL